MSSNLHNVSDHKTPSQQPSEAALSQAATDATSLDPRTGLTAVRALRELADRLEAIQVANARSQQWSWQAIADVLQVSRQAVHQKHSQ